MTTHTTAQSVPPMLDVQGIEVIYNHVILVLKGVSIRVDKGRIAALLGGNGAGKTTTLRAVSCLLRAERGEVTKGSIHYEGRRIDKEDAPALVRQGVVQVMEGRHCFAHLTIEDNLLAGAYSRRDGKGAVQATLDKVYTYFPRLKERRHSQAAYTSGGEQQMCAIGRALMASPKLILLDEPSMGLAPQVVDEVFANSISAKARLSCWPSRTRPWPCAMPITATSWRTAVWSSMALRRIWPPTMTYGSSISVWPTGARSHSGRREATAVENAG
jgi:branched-chain amino acid transport system ATP-binding protein